MKRTTNKIQHDYMVAKAFVETLEEQQKQIEQDYISANGIVNPDGSVPKRIYCILDEDTFDKANEETSAKVASSGLEAEYNAAKDALKVAENCMVEYGLSLAPVSICSTLAKGTKDNYAIREKLIDLVFHLDVSTVHN